jgi:cyclic pyranopterin phosphate synthase
MPESGVKALSHEDILSYEEILRIVRCLARLGISRIKVTGGEPLIRRDVTQLIGKLKAIEGIEKVTLTTNGTHLAEFIEELARVKINGINLSLDTLDAEVYEKITKKDQFNSVYEGFLRAASFPDIKLKINCVPMGMPEQNLIKVVGLAKKYHVHVRFIEMMPIGLGKDFSFQSEAEIIKELEQAYGKLVPYEEKLGSGPCHYYSIENFKGKIGFISAISHKFCGSCNRIRLTADGYLKTCLQYDTGANLKRIIRSGGSDQDLEKAILQAIQEKPGEHSFTEENVAGGETKSMFQIGG